VVATGTDRPVDLVGGVVAFNEERRLPAAVESLLGQELPPGVRWKTVSIVASGCTDRTPEVARALASRHPEIRVRIQPERRGKASALGEIFQETWGDYLVLLNADAIARPGAVSALLDTAASLVPPFAVMGHPEPSELPPAGMGSGLQLLWRLHHRLHAELLRADRGTHLSDELLLLPISHLPPLPEEIVNDGAYIGAWLRAQGGRLAYAEEARVAIEVPWSLPDHIRQRRRIHVGHRQVADLVGIPPSTMGRYFIERPGRALGLLADEVRTTSGGSTALAWLVAGELASMLAATWDRLPPRRNHRLWTPIRAPPGSPKPYGRRAARTSASPATSDRAG
jgi:Glycosyl transferase family 2